GADGCLIPDCQDMQIVTDTGVVTLTGIEAPPAVEETPFRLFPNPARDYVRLQASHSYAGGGPLRFALLNALGQPVLERRWPAFAPGREEHIPLGELSPGWYTWALRQEGRMVQSGKLVVGR
ncbi:MAG: hypothetical protein J5I98_25570, partial [Phaeodactylibacter sp.]|nr:hypothetical protein [Phaeodactylibacter sp.]